MYSAWANHLSTQERDAKSQQEDSHDSSGGGNEGSTCLPALGDGEKEESQVLILTPVPTTPEDPSPSAEVPGYFGGEVSEERDGERG